MRHANDSAAVVGGFDAKRRRNNGSSIESGVPMRKQARCASSRLTVPCVAALLVAPLTHAVSLSPRGTGQVLIYPYYTVNGGQNTLLSLINNSGRAKALKLHF